MADEGLAEFYARVQTAVRPVPTAGAWMVTSRTAGGNAGRRRDRARGWRAPHDSDYRFSTWLKGDTPWPPVLQGRIAVPLLKRMYAFGEGKRRGLERLRKLLRTVWGAARLEAAWTPAEAHLVEASDKVLEDTLARRCLANSTGTAQDPGRRRGRRNYRRWRRLRTDRSGGV